MPACCALICSVSECVQDHVKQCLHRDAPLASCGIHELNSSAHVEFRKNKFRAMPLSLFAIAAPVLMTMPLLVWVMSLMSPVLRPPLACCMRARDRLLAAINGHFGGRPKVKVQHLLPFVQSLRPIHRCSPDIFDSMLCFGNALSRSVFGLPPVQGWCGSKCVNALLVRGAVWR